MNHHGHGASSARVADSCPAGTVWDATNEGMRVPRWWSRERPAEPTRSTADDDARALALGLAGLAPLQPADPMSLGLVLEQGETAYRVHWSWLSHRTRAGWSQPVQSRVVVTDRRLIVGTPLSSLTSLWWGSLVGFHPDLGRSSLVLDYGDGYPRLLSGPDVASAVVVGVAALYGVGALAEHGALEPLRNQLH